MINNEKVMDSMELFAIVSKNRISIKRAVARFFYTKKIQVSEDMFYKIVRRTQDNGYKSGIDALYTLFAAKGYKKQKIKSLLYSFTIEYNMEMNYFRMFPQGNKNIKNILFDGKSAEDKAFFNTVLYDIVKANALQTNIIDSFT